MSYVPRCGCDWWKETRREARDLPQAFIAKWLPVISETTFHFKAPDLVAVEVACFFGGWGGGGGSSLTAGVNSASVVLLD